MTLIRWISSAVIASLALTARSTSAGVPAERSPLITMPHVTPVFTNGVLTSRKPESGRMLFSWSGRVDREVYLTMRGREVRVSGEDWRRLGRTRVNSALPRARGDVEVRLHDGRGEVRIIEQPSARNGYSTTIRIRDRKGGADGYRLSVFWYESERAWDRGRDEGGDRDRDRGRDNGRDRGRDDDRRGSRWDIRGGDRRW